MLAIPVVANATTASVTRTSTNNIICTNYAAAGLSPKWTALNTIGIDEVDTYGFGNTGSTFFISIRIDAPAGWEFNSAHIPAISVSTGDLEGSSTIASFTSAAITINVSGTGDMALDHIRVNDLQARPATTSPSAGNVTISVLSGTIIGIAGGESLGTLTPETAVAGTASVSVGATATAICAGEHVTFTATPTNGGLAPSYQWRINGADVPGATFDAYTSSALADGDEVDVVMTGYGCITSPNAVSGITTMTITPSPAVITGTTAICLHDVTSLGSSPTGGTWSSSDMAVGTVSTTGEVTGLSAGTTTITYELASGCKATADVTVSDPPEAFAVTGIGSYCAGGTGLAIGLDNSATATTYDLYDGSGYISSEVGTGAAISFGTYTAAGTYTVTALNIAGCAADMTGSAVITIIPLSTPAVSVTSTPGDTVCSGTAVTFTATPVSGGTAPTYAWSVNSMPMGTGDTYSYTPANGDVVNVVLTSNVVCPTTTTATDGVTMVVVPYQAPAVTIAATNTRVCQHTPVIYSVAGTAYGGAGPVYTWYKGATSTGITGPVYTYAPANGDVVSVRLNSNYRCTSSNNVASNAITMYVDSVYAPSVSISANTGLNIAAGERVTFTAATASAGATPGYQWVKNKTAIPGATAATYTTAALANNDSITCVVWGSGLCSYHSFNSVKMKVAAGIDQVGPGLTGISLSPNPNNGSFYLKGSLNTGTDTEVWLEVTNMMGQVIYSTSTITNDGNIDTYVQPADIWPDGMYILSVRTATANSAIRFTKQH
ncbi:hypothetical protein GCM10023093_02930 [Nemorincola caseinilytica]|uniref:BIG2 domain-containing protein n=1 Tax=Nemorincola caseinilytica TaxID=2054315 RepID=A0ABP8N2Y2_9BACT